MSILRFAWHLAFSRDVRHRWRQWAVALASFAVCLLALTGLAVLHAATASDARMDARRATYVADPDQATVFLSARGLVLPQVGQIPVTWISPASGHEDDPSIVPPGLDRLPEPGSVVLSPGLVALGWSADDLGMSASTAGSGPGGVIGEEGLSSRTEGWVYARPAAGRSLGEGGALIPSTGFPQDGSGSTAFETMPDVPSRGEALLGLVWLVVLPGIYLAVTAARSTSWMREARVVSLWALGISGARIRAVLVLESGLLAVCGALPAAAVYLVAVAPRTALPLTRAELMEGDFTLPLPAVAGVPMTVTALVMVAAALVRVPARPMSAASRRVGAWHTVPLALAMLMMAASSWLSVESGGRVLVLFGGLILFFLALPMALPPLVSRLGDGLAGSARPAAWLAGRRLSLRAGNLSRPAAMIGALVFTAGAAYAIHAAMTSRGEGYEQVPGTAAFLVQWRDSEPGDLDTVMTHLADDWHAFPVSESGRIATTSCASLALALPGPVAEAECDGGEPAGAYRDYLRQTMGLDAAVVTEAPDTPDAVLVASPEGTGEQDVMRALAQDGQLPAINITGFQGSGLPPNPDAYWLLAAWTMATVVLSLGLLREMGDRTLNALRDHPRITAIGLTDQEVDATYRWTFLTPNLVALPIGIAAAVVFALMGYNLGLTTDNIGRVVGVASVVAALICLTFAGTLVLHRRMLADR